MKINEVSKYIWVINHGWLYDPKHDYWFKGNVKFKRIHGLIIEIFEHDEYSNVNAEGKVVVDVGAYMGDSAIYFAMRGLGVRCSSFSSALN